MTDPPGTRAAFLDLVALHTVDDLGIAGYVAGTPAQGRHVMRVRKRRGLQVYRTLLRGEARAWAGGIAAGAGYPELAGQLDKLPTPALMPFGEAAQRLRLTKSGLDYALKVGNLYPLYGNTASIRRGRARYLFTDQVDLEVVTRELRGTLKRARRGTLTRARRTLLKERLAERTEAWMAVRAMLPTPVRESMAGVDIRPLPSPDPLPLDPGRLGVGVLNVQGLQLAEQCGWLTYHYLLPHGYAVTVADREGAEVDITVPVEGLLAWLLGLADWHGRADLVAYRPGLGG